MNELVDTFLDPFAKKTVAIIDVFFIEYNESRLVTSPLVTRRVISKQFYNTSGQHAEQKIVDWLERLMETDSPREQDKSGFISVKLYISRSPCSSCVDYLQRFILSHLRDFKCEGYFNSSSPSALGIFEVFFPCGYYQGDAKFNSSMKTLVEINENSKGVLVKPGIMDINSITALTKASKEEVCKQFDIPSFEKNLCASRAALRNAMCIADTKFCDKFDAQDALDPHLGSIVDPLPCPIQRERRGQSYYKRRDEDVLRRYQHKGTLTMDVISTLRSKAEGNVVDSDTFLQSVGFCKNARDKPHLYHHALMECHVCFYDTESKSIVCLWNGYNIREIDELVDHCSALVWKKYWFKQRPKQGNIGLRFGCIDGKSMHRPYLFYLSGQDLGNKNVHKVSRWTERRRQRK